MEDETWNMILLSWHLVVKRVTPCLYKNHLFEYRASCRHPSLPPPTIRVRVRVSCYLRLRKERDLGAWGQRLGELWSNGAWIWHGPFLPKLNPYPNPELRPRIEPSL